MLSCSWVVELPRISLLSQSAWWFHENLWTYLSSVESGHFGIIQKYGSNRIWTKPPTTYYFWWVWIDRYIMRYLRRFIGDVDGFPSWWMCFFGCWYVQNRQTLEDVGLIVDVEVSPVHIKNLVNNQWLFRKESSSIQPWCVSKPGDRKPLDP